MVAMPNWDACTMDPHWWMRNIECHPGLAAYVGAVGTIIALGVAIVVPFLSDKLNRRHDKESLLESLRGTALSAAKQAENLRTAFQRDHTIREYFLLGGGSAEFTRIANTIEAIPAYRLGNAEISAKVTELVSTLHSLSNFLVMVEKATASGLDKYPSHFSGDGLDTLAGRVGSAALFLANYKYGS
jgi:hypothetical protein